MERLLENTQSIAEPAEAAIASFPDTMQAAPRRFNTLRRHASQIGFAVIGTLSVFAAHPEKAQAECITLPTGVVICPPGAQPETDPTATAPVSEQPVSNPAPEPETAAEPSQPRHHQPSQGEDHSDNQQGNHQPDHHKQHPKHHRKNQMYGPDRKVSFDQCGWSGALGVRMCGTGCGPTALADVLSDMTRYHVTPPKAARMLGDKYYIPGSGTDDKGFGAAGRQFGLEVRNGNTGSAQRALKSGGVAIALFDNGKAIERSGDSSSVAVNAHYVVLDGLKNGKFTMADPHKGSDRHNERTRNGATRFWTVKQMNREGLVDLWTVTK